MISSIGIRKALALSIVPCALLVLLASLPMLHDHECDGTDHRDCAGCILFHAAVALTAVFTLAGCALLAGTVPIRRTFFEPEPDACEKTTRAPPLLPA